MVYQEARQQPALSSTKFAIVLLLLIPCADSLDGIDCPLSLMIKCRWTIFDVSVIGFAIVKFAPSVLYQDGKRLTSWIKCSGQTGCQGLSECNRPKWIQRDTGYSKEPAGFINDFDKKEEPAGSACGGIGDECTGDECTGDDCIEKYADNTKPCDARCVDCKPQSVVEMKLSDTSTDTDEEGGEFRGDPSTEGGNPGISHGHLPSVAPHSWTADEPSSFHPSNMKSFSIQGHHNMSRQMPKHQLAEHIANAKAVGIVNVLGYGNHEVSICRKLFGVVLPITRDTTEPNHQPKWRLVQMLCCIDANQQPLWDASLPVTGDAIKPILCNASSVPLVVGIPPNETNVSTSSDNSVWIKELQTLFTAAAILSRYSTQSQHTPPVVIIGACSDVSLSSKEKLQSFVSTELGIFSKFCLTSLSNSYQEVLQAIIDFICVKSPWPEIVKLVFQARCEGTETLTWTDIEGALKVESSSSDFITTVMIHLERIGLVLTSSHPSVRTGDVVVAEKHKSADLCNKGKNINKASEDELFLVLQPHTFSNSVMKLMDNCKIVHADLNQSLIVAARQYGLVPRDTVDDVVSSLDSAVLSTLHKTGTLLYPQHVTCHHTNCSDKIYITDSNMNALSGNAGNVMKNARLCLFVPALSAEGSGSEVMTGYVSTSPLLFRQEGPYFGDIPLPLFYLLVAYLMKHFPYFVKCWRYSARFHVDPQHVLHVEYLQHSIKMVMHVQTTDPMFLQVTGNVCNSVREMVTSHLNVLTQTVESVTDMQLQPAAFIPGREMDFVDLKDINPLTSEDQLYSISGNDFCLHDNFYLWYGRLGKRPSGIQNRFFSLSNDIKASLAAAWLYKRELLHYSELDRILTVDRDARCQLLLRILEKKGSKGEVVLDAILQQSQLMMTRTKNIATQTFPDMATHEHGQDQDVICEPPTQRSMPRLHNEPDRHSSSRQQPLSGNAEQTITSNLNKERDQDQQPLNSIGPDSRSRRQSSNEAMSSVISPDGDLLGTRRLSPVRETAKRNLDEESEQSRMRMPPIMPTIETHSMTPQDATVSQQQSQPVVVTSTSATFSGLQEQELAFPRAQPSSLHSPTNGAANTVDPSLFPQSKPQHMKGDPEIRPIFESKYWHVERATNHFNEARLKDGGKRLGSGSFSTVFHGVLHSESGQTFEVAVKRLKKASSLSSAQAELSKKQFSVEMNVLTRYIHKNVVRLLGFSSDGPELCLIYEYMQRGALSHRLDCQDKSAPLDWRVRLKIGRDIASALEFLHTTYRQPVIHRDVKSSNVLLGANSEAKLSDFGLAIIGDVDGEVESARSASVGTRPYMAPEAFQGVVSTKVDVYGLGVTLFELATGLPPYSSKKKQNLKRYLEEIERQNVNMTKMLDPKARWPARREWQGKSYSFGVELLNVGKLATTTDHTRRPEIAEILFRLKSLTEKLEET